MDTGVVINMIVYSVQPERSAVSFWRNFMKKSLFGVCLAVMALGFTSCSEPESNDPDCTVNTCSGNVSMLCINGQIIPKDCGTAGCNLSTGTCNPNGITPQCTTNACSGNIANLCVNGAIVPQDCGAAGCNAATGTCNNIQPPTCDTVAVQAQCAAAGKQFNAASCSCIDNTNPDPGDNPVAGASCDPGTYEGGCNADGSKRYYCGNDGKLVEKDCNTGTTCVVKGNNSSTCENSGEVADCAPGGTAYCNKVCKADGSEGYYYSKGEVHTVSCPNNDCSTASGKVECTGGITPEPGDNPVAGASCDKNTYEGGCNADGSKRYYCGNDGKLVEKDCNTGTTCVVKGNNSSTCENSGEVADCAPGGTVYCNKVCKADGSEGYYYSKGEVHTVSCPNNDCSTASGKVECSGGTTPEPGDGPVAGASCDKNTYEGGCNADGSKRYYCGSDGKLVEKTCNTGTTCVVKGNNSSTCENAGETEDCKPGGTVYCNKVCKADGSEGYYYSKGEVHTVSCPNKDCTTANGKVECSGGSTPEPGDEPVAGAPCNINTYEGGCSSDGSRRYYCGNNGQLVEKACNAGTSCVVNGNNSSTCKTNVVNPEPGDEPVAGASCDKASYEGGCSSDGSKRYYCGNDGKLVEKACSTGYTCTVNGNNSSSCVKANTCKGDTVTTGGTPGTSCCDAKTYQVSCTNNNANALICSGGTVKEWTCANNVCSVSDNKVDCPMVNEGTCDIATFEPFCESDSLGYRCNSSGLIIKYTCDAGKKCDIDYTYPKYPNGFIKCI